MPENDEDKATLQYGTEAQTDLITRNSEKLTETCLINDIIFVKLCY